VTPSTPFAAIAIVIGLVLMLFAVPSITIGSGIEGPLSDFVALTNSQDTLTAARYDSYESPRGTDYVVPAGKTLYIVSFIGWPEIAPSTDEVFDIGYGDDAVNNSASPPTNAIVVCDITWEGVDSNPVQTPLFCPIPAGKYPFVYSSGAGNFQATGTVR